MEQHIKGGIYISTKEIQLLSGSTCIRTAQREHKRIRKKLGVKSGRLTIRQYCEYYEIRYQDILNYLKQYR